MTINYDKQIIEDLKNVDPLQARMLLDFFENKYSNSTNLTKTGKVFTSGKWRVLFNQEDDNITVLRIIQ